MGNAALYGDRVNHLAYITAGRNVPSSVNEDVNFPQFLSETGFDAGRYEDASDEAFRYAVNHHLLGMELGLAPMFRYVSHDGAPAVLAADLHAYESPLDRATQRRVVRLLPNSPHDAPAMSADDLHRHFSEVIEHQTPAEAMVPLVRTFLKTMNDFTEGLVVNCAQLELMARGLDTGKIEIAHKDRDLLHSKTLDVTTTDGGQAKASLWWLVGQLNDFIESTAPEERGVIASDYRYNKVERAIAAVINNRKAAGAVLKSAILLLAPVLLEGPHGRRVGAMLPDIVDSAFAGGNMALLDMLIRNGQPLVPGRFKPQYMEEVTTAENRNAWQLQVALPRQKGMPYRNITLAECLRALREVFVEETIERYGLGVATTLARLPMRVAVADPEGLLRTVGFPFIGVLNHRSYVDIGAAATALFTSLPRGKRRHKFVAKDELPPMTMGIGSFLMAHLLIERTKGKTDAEVERLKAWTWDAYGRVLDWGIKKIFWQGTRSLFDDWRDLKKRGDGILEKKFRSAGLFGMGVAQMKGVPILLMHLKNTGGALMYEQAPIADVLGVGPRFRDAMRNINTIVPGTEYMGHIVLSVLGKYDPSEVDHQVLIDEMVAAMNRAEGITP
jgi:hypothetical protein